MVEQINVVTRRCAVQEQAAARWRTLRAEVAAQEARVYRLREQLSVQTERITKTARGIPTLPDGTLELRKRLDQVRSEQGLVDGRMTVAKGVLVREAAAIMGLESGQIAGLKLPPPRDMKCESGCG